MVNLQFKNRIESDFTIDRLSEKVKFYLPLNHSSDLKNYQRIVVLMSKLFGGTSSYEVEGSYIMENGELVFDKIKVIESFASGIKNSDVERLQSLAVDLKTELNQETIGLEINNVLYFIK